MTAAVIPASDLFPGDVILWEQFGSGTPETCDVHRIFPEKDGRFTLLIQPRSQRSRTRTVIVPADLPITRIY